MHMHQTGAQPNLAGDVARHTSAKCRRGRVRISSDESAYPGQKFFDAYSNGMIDLIKLGTTYKKLEIEEGAENANRNLAR